jgi:AcrR family transcriptional regulator
MLGKGKGKAMRETHITTERGSAGSDHAVERQPETRLRADARRNLERILAAARDAFVELGPDAPLDEVAQRAGVGIATLYRRFPNRQALARAVAMDVWQGMAREAERARTEEPNAFSALARYMHRALDLQVGAVMPLLAGELPMDDKARMARDGSAAAVQRLVETAQVEGTLRPDVAFGDMGLLLIRLNRPLPVPFPRAVDAALAHRHLELFLDGLRADPGHAHPLPGPALSAHDLLSLSPDATNGIGRVLPAT